MRGGFWKVLLGMALVLVPGLAMAEGLALVGGRIIPAPDQEVIEDGTVLVHGGRIVALGPRQAIVVPDGYRIEALDGGTVMAGFWNSHVHLTQPAFFAGDEAVDAALEQSLEAMFSRWGFTTVFDLASTTEIARAVRQRLEQGRVKGPRVLSVGEPFYPHEGTPIYARPIYEALNLPSAEVADAEAATVRARAQTDAGLDGLKLFTGAIVGEGAQDVLPMDPQVIAAVVAVAREAGRPVFAHPSNAEGLHRALEGGVTVLAHAAPLMGPWSPQVAEDVARRGVALVPTLDLFAQVEHRATPTRIAVQQAKALHQAGGRVLFGTDVGFTEAYDTTNEMRLMQEALGWEGLLAALTTNPAEVFGEAGRRGQLAAGMVADVVVVEGDPREDVSRMSAVRLVLKEGAVIYRQ